MRKVPTNNQHLFYQPKDVWVGDVMPFGKDGTFYLYHQRDTRDPAPLAEGQPFGWSLATTQDFVTYQEHGTAIPHGGEDDQDQFIYAGTVYEAKGEVRAFYTGFNRNYLREGKTSQVLMQAKACSDDYATWKKTGVAVELTPQPGYDGRNWRDPFVIWDDDRKEYLLVLGTRKGDDPSKTLQTGRLVHFTSKDLEHWQFKGDFWAPGLYTMFEMPDIFKIGDWWYLVYSEYSDENKIVYRMSRDLYGRGRSREMTPSTGGRITPDGPPSTDRAGFCPAGSPRARTTMTGPTGFGVARLCPMRCTSAPMAPSAFALPKA